MKLYVYCVVDDSADVQKLVYSGVTLLRLGEFNVLVSDFDGTSVPVTRQNVLKHAAVVSSVLPETTPLPFRFGTLATKPHLEKFLSARTDALREKLALVRGCIEMNVKVIWNADVAEEPGRETPHTPGAAFLAQKRREILGSETRVAEAKRVTVWLDERVGEVVREKKIEANPTDKLLLAAAHLVERDFVDEYRARLKAARAERPDLHFLVSGPWAPYSFANIDLEFTTRFGVS
jgi:gas vesicle protein GvpL/GvpF